MVPFRYTPPNWLSINPLGVALSFSQDEIVRLFIAGYLETELLIFSREGGHLLEEEEFLYNL